MEHIANQSKPQQIFKKLSAVLSSVCEKLPEFKLRSVLLISLPLLAFVVTGIIFSNLKHVAITTGDQTINVTTFSSQVSEILSDNNIPTTQYDKISFSGFDNNYAVVNIKQAFKVSVVADGETTDLMVPDGTVSDIIDQAGVEIQPDDLVSESLDTLVSANMVITIKRVTYDTTVSYKSVAFDTEQTETAALAKGNSKVTQEGKEGTITVTQKVKYIDGVLDGTVSTDEELTTEPVTEKILVGTASATPHSDLTVPSSLKLDSNGRPVNYSKVITGKATAYSAKQGTKTATGKTTMCGYVAVNPNVIPYGTKLYIMTSNGSYVYGYAAAYDTGLFATNGSGIIADLFFDTSSEARAFAVRTVDIYILN